MRTSDRCPGQTLGIHIPRLLRAVDQGVLAEDLAERFGVSQRTLSDIIAYHRRKQPADKKAS